ncbi:bacteriophage holin [Kibdelosporangium phytohabitans]|uniref:bacteriophage holin n=1 Tax=Kibdelosporangium phytohabitans TaxID=860235 RepID=UPI0030B83A2B
MPVRRLNWPATSRQPDAVRLPDVQYIPAVVLLAVGLVVLVLVLLKTGKAARKFAVTRGHVNAEVGAATGMLKARKAALRIAVRDRFRRAEIDKSTEA